MVDPTIYNFIKNHVDDRGIPSINNKLWLEFIEQHDIKDIKNALSEYIVNNDIPFPTREIEYIEFVDLFYKFLHTSMLSEYKDLSYVEEKHNYKYSYKDNPLGVIDKSHYYNSVSNYFQQTNRMKCGSNLVDSPYTIWHDKDKLKKMNWHFWRQGAFKNKDICDSSFREAFRIGTYTATQFKPSVAKALYEKHNAINVLDTSCGWGDRLAGFYCSKNTRTYTGCDPNKEVYETYKLQCIEYEKLLGNTAKIMDYSTYFICRGSKTVKIYNLPSEDVDWSIHSKEFDFYFTSPPYYETERYGLNNHETQSWHRYNTFQSWKNDFFFKVNRMIYNTLQDNAFMMINIIEPRISNGTRLNLCDDMVDYIKSFPDMYYIGKIGMRLQIRPHNIVDVNNNSVFIEPIWVFRKNNNKYIVNVLDELFTFE